MLKEVEEYKELDLDERMKKDQKSQFKIIKQNDPDISRKDAKQKAYEAENETYTGRRDKLHNVITSYDKNNDETSEYLENEEEDMYNDTLSQMEKEQSEQDNITTTNPAVNTEQAETPAAQSVPVTNVPKDDVKDEKDNSFMSQENKYAPTSEQAEEEYNVSTSEDKEAGMASGDSITDDAIRNTSINPVVTPEKEPVQDVLDDPDTLSNYEKYAEALGLNDDSLKEKVYTTEQEQKALGRQQNWSAIGEVFKLIMEGAGASGGMYVDKREANPYMERTYKRLQELKDKDLLDARRREQNRVSNELKKVSMFNDYKTRQGAYDQSDKNREDQQEFASGEAEKNREHTSAMQDKRISANPQNDKEFIKWKAELEKQMRLEIARETSKVKIAEIEARYNEMFDYQKKINDEGLTGDGVKINGTAYTEDQVMSEANKIIKTLNADDFGYDSWMKDILTGEKAMTYNQAQQIIRDYYKGDTTQDTDEAMIESVVDPINGDTPVNGAAWDDNYDAYK